jgi:hypothetical protein
MTDEAYDCHRIQASPDGPSDSWLWIFGMKIKIFEQLDFNLGDPALEVSFGKQVYDLRLPEHAFSLKHQNARA